MTYFQISKLTTSRAVVLFAHLGKSLIPSINYRTRIIATRLLTMVVNRAVRRRLIFLIYGTKTAPFFERPPRRRYFSTSAFDQDIFNLESESKVLITSDY